MNESKSHVGWYWAGAFVLLLIIGFCVKVVSEVGTLVQTVQGMSHTKDHQPNDLDLTLPQLDQMFTADPKKAEAAMDNKDVVITGKLDRYQPTQGGYLLVVSGKGSKSRAVFKFTEPEDWVKASKSDYKVGSDMFCRGIFQRRDKSGEYEFNCISVSASYTSDSNPTPKAHPAPKPKTSNHPE